MKREKEQETQARCRGCVWNSGVWCGRDFCMLPRCMKREEADGEKQQAR